MEKNIVPSVTGINNACVLLSENFIIFYMRLVCSFIDLHAIHEHYYVWHTEKVDDYSWFGDPGVGVDGRASPSWNIISVIVYSRIICLHRHTSYYLCSGANLKKGETASKPTASSTTTGIPTGIATGSTEKTEIYRIPKAQTTNSTESCWRLWSWPTTVLPKCSVSFRTSNQGKREKILYQV